MGPIRSQYDVVVVGGGPVGTVAAVAFARLGAEVLVLEADPRACRRFAGEWIHPSGVAVLDDLRLGRLEKAAPRTGYGFVILPDDRSAPIELPYPTGVALACPHEAIVDGLREAAARVPGVTMVPFARVVSIEGERVVAEERTNGRRIDVTARRIVGADGRSSTVRRAIGLQESSTLLSYMASIELRGVELPFEGFGHVILGGPGPALLYRIGEDRVRACLDLPLHQGPRSRSPEHLWDAFSTVLPPRVVPAFRRALTEGPVLWAATRFRPRADFGKGAVALAGDALGHLHPMTAMGLTMGFLDAQSLTSCQRIEEYAVARRGYVPELLSNALYHCFRREDASATMVRETMFRLLRRSPADRRRTMEILSGREERTSSFGEVFLRIAADAIGSTTVQAARRGGLRSVPGALLAYREWLQWPAAGILPRALSDGFRSRSTATHPIPFLQRFVPVNDAPSAEVPLLAGAHAEPANGASTEPRAALPARPVKKPARPAPPVARAMTRATDLLIHELEGIALKLGKVPDDVLGGPALRMMRAITATRMRPGVAARMMIGRRRLATEGAARLLGSAQRKGWTSPVSSRAPFDTSLAAELLVVLLDGSTWVRSRVVGLDELVDALLARQTEGGGFAAAERSASGPPSDDVHVTALACRALCVVRRRMPGAFDAKIDPALARAAQWVREQQAPDGAFAPAEERDRLARTAWAMEALVAAGHHPTEPALRRAVRWLLQRQGPDGAFRDVDPVRAGHAIAPPSEEPMPADALREDAHTRRDTARVLRALLVVKAPHREALLDAAALVATSLAEGRHEEPCAGIAPWEECSEVLEALALHEARAKERPEVAALAGRSEGPSAGELDADWVFCRERLGEVSRSFSKPIALLPRHIEVAVTLGYLLCRVADTVEDHPAVPPASREQLFAIFLDVLHGRKEPGSLAAAFTEIPGDDAQLVLARNLPIVMRVFRGLPERARASLSRWVSEMARGMALYAHREPGADGVIALHTVPDLERYCYFVAGTVGHLLTDLFLDELGDEATPEVTFALRVHAEPFGAGLQLVNILKDLTDDRERRWSYIPRTAGGARGVGVAELSDPSRRAAAHGAVAPLFDVARRNLDDGLRYALAIPPHHTGLRLFCLLPLWMAARTLVLAKGNDAMFTPGQAVKISRDEVEAITSECALHHADDAALRARYAALWGETGEETRRSAG